MNGVHDMGGQQGMGPVEYEKHEPVFHAVWEGRVYALSRAHSCVAEVEPRYRPICARGHASGRLPADELLRALAAQARAARGEVRICVRGTSCRAARPAPGSPERIRSSHWQRPTVRQNRGIASSQDPKVPPRFKVGQRVRARNINPTGHTRLPRYARGKTRRDRSRSRCLPVPGHECPRARREAAARVLGAVHGTRVVG